MSSMKALVAKLLGAGSRLSDLEKSVLHAVGSRFDPQLVLTWERQIQTINRVQRLPEGREVNFYRMVKGRSTFDDGIAFANKTTELHLANVKVSWGKASGELVARVWCVRGFLFTIEYAGGVTFFEEAADMDPPPEFDIACELRANLAQAMKSN